MVFFCFSLFKIVGLRSIFRSGGEPNLSRYTFNVFKVLDLFGHNPRHLSGFIFLMCGIFHLTINSISSEKAEISITCININPQSFSSLCPSGLQRSPRDQVDVFRCPLEVRTLTLHLICTVHTNIHT